MNIDRRLLQTWHALGVLLLSLVTVLSLVPGSELPPAFPGVDKIVHVLMYLALAGWFAVHERPHAVWLFVIFVNYGAAIEVVQQFVPARGFDLWDILANAVGASLGILIVRKLWNPLKWFNAILQKT